MSEFAAPVAKYSQRGILSILGTLVLAATVYWALHHVFALLAAYNGVENPLALTWAVTFALLWWIPLSWFERPHNPTVRQARQLDRLAVTVAVPVFNEPIGHLERCLMSLLCQTRLPDRIHVVDDGTRNNDYSSLRDDFILAAHELGVDAEWTWQPNAGKRHAQALAFAHDGADIYVTCDSDTILDARAIEEGLKPFADPEVQSVAGMVLVENLRDNWLTRLSAILYVPFTHTFRSAQSVLSSVLVNSGPLALYRAETIRPYMWAYPRETFLGRPMSMSDDSLMTLYALLGGRTVHQPTAVAYTGTPATVDVFARQQIRWARGSLVRSMWRLRYLPFRTPGYWIQFANTASFAVAAIVGTVLAFNLGGVVVDRQSLLLTAAVVALVLNYAVSLRYFVLRRSDESLPHAVGTWALAPLAGVWRLLVLRPLILYAYCTFWRVGNWGTRQHALAAPETNFPEMAVSP